MIIRDFAVRLTDNARVTSATVAWEDRDFTDQLLSFEIQDSESNHDHEASEPCVDAFLTGCFPLAAVHGEARLKIDAQPCPMLVDGLRTVHAWWTSWGGMPTAAPAIEANNRGRSRASTGPRHAMCFLSGGVDGL